MAQLVKCVTPRSTKQRLSGVRLPVGRKWLTLRQSGERLPESRCFVEGGVTHFTGCTTFPQSALRKGGATGKVRHATLNTSVIRDYDDTNTNVCGPDGRALATAGHATIVFTLAGLACRHRFLVVEGSSMVLLGNNFLHSRGATINLSITGPCSMTLLTDEDDRKACNVPVTTIPPGEERPMALTFQKGRKR